MAVKKVEDVVECSLQNILWMVRVKVDIRITSSEWDINVYKLRLELKIHNDRVKITEGPWEHRLEMIFS